MMVTCRAIPMMLMEQEAAQQAAEAMNVCQKPPPQFSRLPHRLHFRSPDGVWELTGRINWPSLGQRYEAPPSCEWVNSEGDKIWLPAQYATVVADLKNGAELHHADGARHLTRFLSGLVPRSWKTLLNPAYVAFCYVHLAADVGF